MSRNIHSFLGRTCAQAGMLLALCSATVAKAPLQGIGGADTGYMGHNRQFGKAVGPPSPGSRGVKIHGYDISQYQGTVNFAQFSGAASFVVIRASRGAPDPGQTSAQYADSKLAQNRAGAEQTGMEAGFYHYAYPEYNSAVAEADCFADNVGSLKAGQFVVLDYESSWGGDRVSWCKAWLDRVQNRLGVKPLIYLNLSTARASDWSPVINGGYGLWMARWDYDANAEAPPTGWPFTAMRQYSNNERAAGISGAVDGDVFYGTLDALKAYGYGGGGGTPSSVAWTGIPQADRWYRSDERLNYHVNGDRPNTVRELIDGNNTSTYDTNDGYIPLSVGTPGWHYYEVSASNSANGANPSYTGRWNGGWDPSPPTVTRTSGALPNTWYSSATGVEVTSSDALSGIRRFRYKWDEGGTFSAWLGGTGLTAQLQPGKHRLFVEAEDNAFTGSDELGNRATIDLGEYWLDTSRPNLQIVGRIVSSGSQIVVEVSVTNPNVLAVGDVRIELMQLGSKKPSEGAWVVGDIAAGATVKKSFTFPLAFGANKSLLFSTNYHLGTLAGRTRARLSRP